MESFLHSLAASEINALTGIVWLVASLLFGALAGALSAMKLAGKDIGNELALMMGSVFGPIAVIPGVLLGLVVLKLLGAP